jgi:hypothetical protein
MRADAPEATTVDPAGLLWSVVVVCLLVAYFLLVCWAVVDVVADPSGRGRTGAGWASAGWASAGWVALVVLVPFVGLGAYLVRRRATPARPSPSSLPRS